jgi:hypothetical protein
MNPQTEEAQCIPRREKKSMHKAGKMKLQNI